MTKLIYPRYEPQEDWLYTKIYNENLYIEKQKVAFIKSKKLTEN